MATRGTTPVTCPRCGAALGGSTDYCVSCLATILDPGASFDRWSRVVLIALCVAYAMHLAGSLVLTWARGVL